MESCGRLAIGLPMNWPVPQKRRVDNPPQVANLPYIAPESFRSPWHSRPRVDLAERWPLTACGSAALCGRQDCLQAAFQAAIEQTTYAVRGYFFGFVFRRHRAAKPEKFVAYRETAAWRGCLHGRKPRPSRSPGLRRGRQFAHQRNCGRVVPRRGFHPLSWAEGPCGQARLPAARNAKVQ